MNKAGTILLSKDYKKVGLVYRTKLDDYSFPKGHIEKDESLIECALRETEEETGRKCTLINNEEIGKLEYVNYEGTIYTHLFLAIDNGPTTKFINEYDKENLVWVDINEVASKLTYNDLKEFWLNNLDKINKLIKETSK